MHNKARISTREKEKMKKRIRKLISIGMILCMCAQAAPAFASEGSISGDEQNIIADESMENNSTIAESTEEDPDLEDYQSNESQSVSDDEIEATDPDSILQEEEESIRDEQPAENPEDDLVLKENDQDTNEDNTDSSSETEDSESSVEENTIVLKYQAHIQGIGWQEWKTNGEQAGTTGESRRMEALILDFGDEELNAQIEYRAHVQNIGWQEWVHGGELCGTTGQSLRIEAIQIKLTGSLGETHEIYYQVHISDFGTLDYVQDGQRAGSEGFSKRMEAVQIHFAEKGAEHPETGSRGFCKAYSDSNLQYSAHVQNIGDMANVSNGQIQGTTGKGLRMEGITITLDTSDPDVLDGSIRYCTHIQNIGWQEWKENGEYSGTKGQSYRLEAIKIQLTGEAADYYDIYYRTHVQNIGWMGWAKNGEAAGSQSCSYRMEAIQISLRIKGQSAPGSTENAFQQGGSASKSSLSSKLGVNPNAIVSELIMHQFDDYYLNTKYVGLNPNKDFKLCMRPYGEYANNNPGMNCTGFVAFVFQKCGANLETIGNMGLRGSYCNASNWLRYFKKYNVTYYQYSTVGELLNSGKAEKGDIIFCDPKDWSQSGADCHIGFFWGNDSSDNRFWHSSTKPGSGNQISVITPVTNPSYIYLVKLK